jgi:hypothetical protein
MRIKAEHSPRLSTREPFFYVIRWPYFRQVCLGNWAIIVEW